MARIRLMEHDKGDKTLVEFDRCKLKEVKEAERIFNKEVYGVEVVEEKISPRRLVVANFGRGQQKRISMFNEAEQAEDIIIMPLVIGG